MNNISPFSAIGFPTGFSSKTLTFFPFWEGSSGAKCTKSFLASLLQQVFLLAFWQESNSACSVRVGVAMHSKSGARGGSRVTQLKLATTFLTMEAQAILASRDTGGFEGAVPFHATGGFSLYEGLPDL